MTVVAEVIQSGVDFFLGTTGRVVSGVLSVFGVTRGL